MNKLAVIGAGAWGTALAIAAARAGSDVTLWARTAEVASDINKKHKNSRYLGKIPVHESVKATTDIADINGCGAILMVVPAQSLREMCQLIRDGGVKKAASPIVICSKGVEIGSLALLSDIVKEYFPENPVAILSGPNFADEIANGLPACATIACADKSAADKVMALLGNKMFRLYYSDDVTGAQIGGAVKNVIAIACGIAIGKGLGENARAALVTRGIAEISRLCKKMGGRHETLMGLSGIGDIMLTCSSEKSRNMRLGIDIGREKDELQDILKKSKTVEGVATSESVSMLSKKLGLEMPITSAVKAILHDNACVEETVEALLLRPIGVEG